MEGYVKVYRKILDSSVWSDPYYLKLWMYCLMKATHKEREVILGNQVITLEPGQFITGRKSLSEDLNRGMKPKQTINEFTWWRYICNLEKLKMLHIKKTNKYSVVTILNWHEYQETEQQMHNKCTSDAHQMHTNKNVKNVKNKNNKSHKQVYDESSIYFQLANRLYMRILENNPEHKQPNLQKWANDVRLMMERDGRTEKQIIYLIDWCQKNSFWKSNILSISKLREKYDQLVMQIKSKREEEQPKRPKEYVYDINAGED